MKNDKIVIRKSLTSPLPHLRDHPISRTPAKRAVAMKVIKAMTTRQVTTTMLAVPVMHVSVAMVVTINMLG
jgi:hypothetical protein